VSESPLRLSRESRGLTQIQLAVKARLSVSTIREAELRGIVSRDAAEKIAKALGAPAAERVAWREHSVASRAEQILATIPSTHLVALLEQARAKRAGEPVARGGGPESEGEKPAADSGATAITGEAAPSTSALAVKE
jgi:transcriptional regulator with XRE-family HTH domain